MKKLLCVCLTLTLLLSLAIPALAADTETAQVTGTFCYEEARSLLDMVNDFRTADEAWYWSEDNSTQLGYGPGVLGPLDIDPALEQIAMERARELVLSFSHTRPNGERCFSLTADGVQSWGENIAYGYTSAESVFVGWREDDEPYEGQGHRRNMLGEGYTAVGFGCFLYNGRYYWVQEFGYSHSGAALTDRGNETVTGPVEYSVAAFGSGYWSDEGNCPAANYTPKPSPTPEPTTEPTPEPTPESTPEPDPGPPEEFWIEDGVLYGYNGDGGAVTVPDGVTAIGPRAFQKTAVTSVAVPEGVESIGERAFSHCESLVSVTLPESLREIGAAAFSACGALAEVKLPAGVTTLGRGALSNTALTELSLPAGLTDIPEYLCSECRSLKRVSIPAGVKTVGEGAFGWCGALEEVSFGGTEADWKTVTVGAQNEPLAAALRCAEMAVVLSPQRLTVNGAAVECMKYNINGSNFFKLRDLAALLDGTGSQFDVGWDGARGLVSVTTGSAYSAPDGHELELGADEAATAQPSAQTITVDGAVRTDLAVYNIGGSNYFKLRDLGTALGFDVDYDAGTDTAIVKSR